MIKYEIKKCFLTRKTWVALIACLFVLFGYLLYAECGLQRESKEKKRIFTSIDREMSEENIRLLNEKFQKVKDSLYSVNPDGALEWNQEVSTSPGEYLETVSQDYWALRAVYQAVEKVLTRKQNIQIVLNNAGRDGHMELYNYYKTEAEGVFCDLDIVNMLVKNAVFSILCCFLAVFILSFSIAIEYETKLYPLLEINGKSSLRVVLAKLTLSGGVAVVVGTFLFGCYMLMQYFLLGYTKYELMAPLYFADGFEFCESGYRIMDYLLAVYLISIPVSILFAVVAMFVSSLVRKGFLSMAISEILFGALLLMEMVNRKLYLSGVNTETSYLFFAAGFRRFYEKTKLVLPFSLVDVRYYFEQPRFLVLGKYTVNVLSCQVVSTICLIILLVFLIARCNRLPKRRGRIQ